MSEKNNPENPVGKPKPNAKPTPKPTPKATIRKTKNGSHIREGYGEKRIISFSDEKGNRLTRSKKLNVSKKLRESAIREFDGEGLNVISEDFLDWLMSDREILRGYIKRNIAMNHYKDSLIVTFGARDYNKPKEDIFLDLVKKHKIDLNKSGQAISNFLLEKEDFEISAKQINLYKKIIKKS